MYTYIFTSNGEQLTVAELKRIDRLGRLSPFFISSRREREVCARVLAADFSGEKMATRLLRINSALLKYADKNGYFKVSLFASGTPVSPLDFKYKISSGFAKNRRSDRLPLTQTIISLLTAHSLRNAAQFSRFMRIIR